MHGMNETQRAPKAFTPLPVSARGLAVTRGERTLFTGLDFEVGPGGVLLLRGPNGAGKSTLLMVLAGIVRADAGAIMGLARTDVHLLGYQSGLKPRLTVRENLDFWQAMNGGGGDLPQTALERVGIGMLGALEAGHLSSGQLRRLALARLLVSRRRVWLLDEPSATLDAAGEQLLGGLVDEHRAEGGIAIVATHHDLHLAQSGGVATIVLGGGA
jgi:heme exporter protein A